MKTRTWIGLLAIAVLAGGVRARAAEEAPLTVAVLDFTSGAEATKAVAAALPDLLEADLAAEKGIRLVSRREIEAVQKEQARSLAGLVAAGQGARVGQLLGADVLVLGRVALLDRELILTAKAIGAETGVFLPAVVRGEWKDEVGPHADSLAKKIRHLLVERGRELLPEPDPQAEEEKRVAKAIAKLDVELPTVGVVVKEEHRSEPKTVDPAAGTEIQAVLLRLGFPVVEIAEADAAAALRAVSAGEGEVPEGIRRRVDVLVVGEAFSEFAGRTGEIVSAKARLEVKAVKLSDGRIVAVFADGTAGADLAELHAAKKALAALGRKAALALAPKVAAEGKPRPEKK